MLGKRGFGWGKWRHPWRQISCIFGILGGFDDVIKWRHYSSIFPFNRFGYDVTLWRQIVTSQCHLFSLFLRYFVTSSIASQSDVTILSKMLIKSRNHSKHLLQHTREKCWESGVQGGGNDVIHSVRSLAFLAILLGFDDVTTWRHKMTSFSPLFSRLLDSDMTSQYYVK